MQYVRDGTENFEEICALSDYLKNLTDKHKNLSCILQYIDTYKKPNLLTNLELRQQHHITSLISSLLRMACIIQSNGVFLSFDLFSLR